MMCSLICVSLTVMIIVIISIDSQICPFSEPSLGGFGPKSTEMNPSTFPDLPIHPRTFDFDTGKQKIHGLAAFPWMLDICQNVFWVADSSTTNNVFFLYFLHLPKHACSCISLYTLNCSYIFLCF